MCAPMRVWMNVMRLLMTEFPVNVQVKIKNLNLFNVTNTSSRQSIILVSRLGQLENKLVSLTFRFSEI